VRVHSECVIGDIFGATTTCECRNQLVVALKQIEAAGRGVLVYLRGHEGIGLDHIVHDCHSEDHKYEELNVTGDSTEYGIGAQVLFWFSVYHVLCLEIERIKSDDLFQTCKIQETR